MLRDSAMLLKPQFVCFVIPSAVLTFFPHLDRRQFILAEAFAVVVVADLS